MDEMNSLQNIFWFLESSKGSVVIFCGKIVLHCPIVHFFLLYAPPL